ncbi:MAG TPA: ATPase, T2SS/T4P/T4SS family [Candidatus Bilamarchaeum sp.]|nr:ATPase, T2SS/T4P/T4SS family [Candidatus Bilamarchaeum sp.]
MLGWRVVGGGEYTLDMPRLSAEEEGLICVAEERFREAARGGAIESEKLITQLVSGAAAEGGIYLSRAQESYLARMAHMHIYGFWFMDELLSDPGIEEISVIGPGKPVYVYARKGGWLRVNAVFEDERAIGELINRMAAKLGRRITMQNPRLDAMLPDGSRLHASLPPVSAGEITIRRFRQSPLSPAELVANKTAGAEALAFLSVLMQCDSSVLIAGNTASGKTSTLNALFSFVPSNERVIITEETPEITIPHQHQMRLVANRDMGISLKDLVYDTLRMRPDRMIVGEVRNREESEALFDVLLAGQARGCYATFHAQSAQEALGRLRSFGIRGEDLSSIDCIVVQRRMLSYDPKKRAGTEVRKIVEIAGVAGGDTHAIFPGQGAMKSELFRRSAESFGLSAKEMGEELGARAGMIARAGPGFPEFFKEVQKKLYGLGGADAL